MSKTDKTRPSWVRLIEAGAIEDTEYWPNSRRRYFDHIPKDFKWNNSESAAGPKYIRWAKRQRSKRNRRRDVPWTKMTGMGYGDENYKFQ